MLSTKFTSGFYLYVAVWLEEIYDYFYHFLWLLLNLLFKIDKNIEIAEYKNNDYPDKQPWLLISQQW